LPVRELDLVVCSTGPGSFTGIRIGLATAKGLAAGVPALRLIGVSTLDGLFHRYRRFPGTVVAVNPSLRKKYYAGIYGEGRLEGDYLETTLPDLCALLETRRPLLITGAAAAELYELVAGAGAAGRKAQRRAEIVVDDSLQPSDPAGLLACGLQRLEEPAVEPQPLYLRKSEAEITFFGG
ncbi:MAG: tRNA (adenosine(37)-N6)-threonylcarbamoyltransferase complex dimerization subunit type 1 TsaB, partial [Spirochaetales bacterium]|nr:tRNA (adenosine(37)-N6)-threonylcarbamoyltransferase complex dimerization subunit type 1 TsaB [Spirochaetales bacterium]